MPGTGRFRFSFVAILVGLAASASVARAASFDAALESIRRDDLKRHAAVLASDTLEGREAGTRGGHAAGAYLITHLKPLGVRPAGTDGSFYQYFGADYRNVLALLPGSDPELSREYVIVSAHYDHVGYGSRGTSLGPIGYIHNGADDNASGTAGLLEVIEAFAAVEPRPKRSLLFVFWDAEEKGLLGAEHWVRSPTVPIDRVRLIVNVDMIGRLRKRTIRICGTRTARGLRRLVSEANRETDLGCDFDWTVKRESDHYPFYERRIPALMFDTGKHDDYHRPSDDVDKLNFDGMQQAARLVFGIAHAAADAPQVAGFRSAVYSEDDTTERRLTRALPAVPSRLGITWNRELDPQGIIEVVDVAAGSPAEKAGLERGDRILEFGGWETAQAGDFRTLVHAAVNPVPIVVQRRGESERRTLTARLDGRPRRVGLTWSSDDAEPGTVVVRRVVPGTPADLAGVKVGDRIYAVSGRGFKTSDEFADRIAAQPSPLKLEIERWGRLRTVRVDLPDGAARAADRRPATAR